MLTYRLGRHTKPFSDARRGHLRGGARPTPPPSLRARGLLHADTARWLYIYGLRNIRFGPIMAHQLVSGLIAATPETYAAAPQAHPSAALARAALLGGDAAAVAAAGWHPFFPHRASSDPLP